MEGCAFTLARCCVLAPGLVLFGSACFSLYASPELRTGRSFAGRVGAPALAAAGAIAWIVLLGRQAEGAAGLPSASILGFLCARTGFGRALVAAALLGVALAVLGARDGDRARARAVLSGALLVSLAFVGHAAAGSGPAGQARLGAMAVHLLAAGLWLGALPALARALRARPGAALERLLRRFGAVGLVSVCAILASGLGSGLFVLAMTGGRVGPGYGTTFAVKLALVAALLALAAVNRFRLTPLFARDGDGAVSALRRTVLLEQLLGLGVVVAVALLGQLDPSV
jgi:putative copper resistance protein D